MERRFIAHDKIDYVMIRIRLLVFIAYENNIQKCTNQIAQQKSNQQTNIQGNHYSSSTSLDVVNNDDSDKLGIEYQRMVSEKRAKIQAHITKLGLNNNQEKKKKEKERTAIPPA